jgi:hypothetical protein
MKKKTILIYQNWERSYDMLDTNEQAQFVKNLFLWNRGEQPILNSPGLAMMWSVIEPLLENNVQKYEDKIERMNNARANKYLASTNQVFNKNLSSTSSDNDNDNVKDKDNDNVKDKDKDKDKVKVKDKDNANVNWDSFGK